MASSAALLMLGGKLLVVFDRVVDVVRFVNFPDTEEVPVLRNRLDCLLFVNFRIVRFLGMIFEFDMLLFDSSF